MCILVYNSKKDSISKELWGMYPVLIDLLAEEEDNSEDENS